MSSVFCFCRGNEQCEKSRQSTMGSLLTNKRIDLTFHSATARMSEGKAGANGALRVEFSTFPWFTWDSAQARETAFLGEFTSNSTGEAPHKPGKLLSWGSLPQVLPGKLRANSGTSRAHLHTATGAAFPAPGRAPINRQSPQRASSRLERGALWRSLAQPCARNPRNVSV